MNTVKIGGKTPIGSKTHLDGSTITDRNNVPTGKRQWGMFFTVTDDETASNNTTWVLVEALVDDDKSNNGNWQKITDWLSDLGIGKETNIVPEYFDGDGATTQFNISQSGAVFLVEVGGQLLRPDDDYTVIDQTITIGFAPLAGQKVGVYYYSEISGRDFSAAEQAVITKLQYPFNALLLNKLLEAYEADDVTLDATDTDAIMQAHDKAGSGNSITASSSLTAPTLNGDAMEFPNGNLIHNKAAGDFAKFKTTEGEVAFLVYLTSSAVMDQTLMTWERPSGPRFIHFYFKIVEYGKPRIIYNDGITLHTLYADVVIDEGFHVVSFSGDGSEWKIYIDGNECKTKISGSGSNIGTWWGGIANPDDISMIRVGSNTIKLKALYFFNAVLTDWERRQYVDAFKSKFDLDAFIGLKLVSYGDSITAIGYWQGHVCSRLGMRNVNRGIGGTTVKESGSTAYVDADGNTLTGNPPPGTLGVDYFQILSSMSNQQRVDTIPIDADIILVFGGANDGVASGAIDDPVGVALDTSFYAAYKTMLDRIWTRCPNALIVLMTPPHHATADAVGTFAEGAGYDSMRAAIRAIGYRYGFPVIDLKAKAQINANNYAMYLSDQVHPNTEGGKKIAAVVAHELNVLKPFL